jgi:subtilisin-like proprotein convertase family protein
VTEADTFTLSFQAIGTNGDTIVRDINVQTISNDFSDLMLVSPEPGISGVGIRPTFIWTGSEQADGYHLELSESPAFSNAISIAGLSGLETSLDTALEENTLYYWRIQPFNQCGTGDYTTTAAFHSLNLACETFTPDDLPRNISQSVIVPIHSTIEVSQTGIVEDVNVRSINGFHEAFGDLVFKLAGPLGDTVTLLSRQCGFSSRQFTLGFDSESTLSFGCQSSFQGQIYMPQDSLNQFKGSPIEGDWSLIVIDSMIGSGGAVNQWELELCGSLSPVAPEFSILDTIDAFYDQITTIDNQYLQVVDDASTAEQLIYTLVSPTTAGDLLLDGNPLTVGEQFSQTMVDAGRLEYRHAGLDSLPDAFVCTVIDGSGGWIAPTAIPIRVSQKTVSAQDLIRRWDLKVFPNPATDHLTITWTGLPSDEIEHFRLRDVQGRIILASRINRQTTFETGHLARGTYFAQIIGKDGIAIVKVVLH